MIQFHQVSKYFAGKRAVDNLSLQISKGEFTVLIGTSGSGKSTTLKMINRLIEHDEGKSVLPVRRSVTINLKIYGGAWGMRFNQ